MESKTTAGLSLKGSTLGTESRVRAADSSSREVVRRAVIQSTFRDLRTGGNDDIYLVSDGHPGTTSRIPKISTIAELKKATRKLRKNRALLPVNAINRGDVLELEITLKPDKTYQLVTAISSIIEIVRGREAIFGIDDTAYEQIVPVVEIIDSLLVGLVPIWGTSTRYVVLNIDGHDHIIDRAALASDSEITQLVRPLEVVGVTEFKSYWKDLRRVLFNDSTYTAYVRVEAPVLRDEWNPVKLTDVLRTVSMDIDSLIKELPDAFETPQKQESPRQRLTADFAQHLIDFGTSVGTAAGVEVDQEKLQTTAIVAAANLDLLGDVDARRHIFDLIVNAVAPDIDRETVRYHRDSSIKKLVADADIPPSSPVSPQAASQEPGRKLEVEFVAIYW
ncbi:hypothetical protein AB0J90_01200 [Micromonospora sp. NPDC049523]|uniref:DUF6414 family protein n=1 Tax=Micromonospora sp. NPDC049523 TaxID=3155921 RepID=UPI00343842A0